MAAGAVKEIGHFGRGVVPLAADAETLGPAGELISDGVVIVNVAALRAGAHLPASHAHGADGVLVLQGPRHLVEAVDVLLDVVVAAQPREVVPVADLPLHLRPLLGVVRQRRLRVLRVVR